MLENRVIKGYILLKSGLHIGGTEAGIHIGGIDNPVIKNPLTGLPYIPGSSLKGKMRFLLEHAEGLVKSGNIPNYSENNVVAKVFGHLEHDKHLTKPTRVIFRDSHIIGAMKEFNIENILVEDIDRDVDGIREKMGSDFVEGKTEVVIDRLSGTAKRGGLRQIERVSAGTVFSFEITLRSFEDNESDKHFKLLKKGLKLLENDALGGSGSRGSGKVKFFGLTDNDKEFSLE
ncbi:MAG TPA: type III-A CRISPR-associated RAMP protein Csm3 [Candidatus Cloacimonadota bacterium]|nr:type III-A CRISPR-associated RAMP protein Csm3 [Candidatus Cloacimonadota bacterium]